MCGGLQETFVRMPADVADAVDPRADADYEGPPSFEVPLCVDCRDISYRMVTNYDTSPIPEWDTDELKEKHKPTDEIIDNAFLFLSQSDEDHIPEYEVKSATIVIHAASEAGVL